MAPETQLAPNVPLLQRGPWRSFGPSEIRHGTDLGTVRTGRSVTQAATGRPRQPPPPVRLRRRRSPPDLPSCAPDGATQAADLDGSGLQAVRRQPVRTPRRDTARLEIVGCGQAGLLSAQCCLLSPAAHWTRHPHSAGWIRYRAGSPAIRSHVAGRMAYVQHPTAEHRSPVRRG